MRTDCKDERVLLITYTLFPLGERGKGIRDNGEWGRYLATAFRQA
jgi:hypothetical protein